MAAVKARLEGLDQGEPTQPLAPAAQPRKMPTRLVAGAVLALAAAAVVVSSLRTRDVRALPASKLLAILPATDLTGRADGRPFCDGVSASLRVKLQRLKGLQVMVPSSPAAVREGDPSRSARDTGANLLVQPMVRQTGDRLQLSYSLVLAGSPVQLAADEVEGPPSELFRLEEELTARLLGSLQLHLGEPAGRDEVTATREGDYVLALGYLEQWDDPASLEKAIQLLSALPRGSESARVQAALGRAFLRSYELSRETAQAEKGRAAAERAIGLDPERPEALLTLGRLGTLTGRPGEGVEAIRKAIRMLPESADAELALASALDATGAKEEAEQAFRRAARLRPSSWVVASSLADFLFRTDRYEEAAETFRRAAALNPDAPTVHFDLGAVLFRLGRIPEAEAAFRRSLAIRPTAVAWSNLGTLFYADGRFGEAVTCFEKAVALTPGDYFLWMNLADGLDRVGRGGEAREAYERTVRLGREALAVNPRSGEAHAAVAAALARTGRHAEAAAEARQAVALEGDDPNVLMVASLVAELGGRQDEALAWIEKGLAHGLTVHEIEAEPAFARVRDDPRWKAAEGKARKKEKE